MGAKSHNYPLTLFGMHHHWLDIRNWARGIWLSSWNSNQPQLLESAFSRICNFTLANVDGTCLLYGGLFNRHQTVLGIAFSGCFCGFWTFCSFDAFEHFVHLMRLNILFIWCIWTFCSFNAFEHSVHLYLNILFICISYNLSRFLEVNSHPMIDGS